LISEQIGVGNVLPITVSQLCGVWWEGVFKGGRLDFGVEEQVYNSNPINQINYVSK
jgi:hypothetical protein